ncbi:hypothetical protein BS17DRAFT_426182 [Gyrodon lividus]|nr:hypothetical protein BS17DRAFT_426182 [Gyrodon lividus]
MFVSINCDGIHFIIVLKDRTNLGGSHCGPETDCIVECSLVTRPYYEASRCTTPRALRPPCQRLMTEFAVCPVDKSTWSMPFWVSFPAGRHALLLYFGSPNTRQTMWPIYGQNTLGPVQRTPVHQSRSHGASIGTSYTGSCGLLVRCCASNGNTARPGSCYTPIYLELQ